MWHSTWNDAATLNRIAAGLALLAFGALAVGAIRHVANRPEFAVKTVVVSSKLEHVDPAHVTAVVQQELRGTFFTLDLVVARNALSKVTWVRNVAVRRHWPARLEVVIEEHQPLARWNDVALVNAQGEVFDAEYGEELPDFYGPDGSASDVTARYREFSTALERGPVGIESLSRSARGAWDVKLDDGLVVALGREQVSERWARWVQVSEKYRNRIAPGNQLAAVDMRYAHGFAARLAGGAEAVAAIKPVAGTANGTVVAKTAAPKPKPVAAAKPAPNVKAATAGNQAPTIKAAATAAAGSTTDSTLGSTKSAAKG